MEVRFGGTPKPTRGTRVLPGISLARRPAKQRVHSLRIMKPFDPTAHALSVNRRTFLTQSAYGLGGIAFALL